MKRALLALLLTGCLDVVEHGTPMALTVTTTDCSQRSVVGGATQVSLTVTVGSRVLLARTDPIDAIPTRLGLPAAPDAQLRVVALDGSGQTVARGSSTHFEVVDGGSIEVELFAVDRFSRLCTSLGQARAFHTATTLPDGRVLFVGGLGRTGEPISSMEVLSTTASDVGPLELVTPTGRFPMPRERHAAVLASSGQVLISGGEVQAPLSTALVVDPQLGFATGALRATPRSRHAAFELDSALFLYGGSTIEGGVAVADRRVERLDLTTAATLQTIATLPSARLEAALTVSDSTAYLAGGVEDGGVSAQVQRVLLDTHFVPPALSLHTARRSATAIGVGTRVLVAGGFGAAGEPLGSTEWLETDFVDGPAIAPRGGACAVALDGDAVLLVGGLDGNGPSAIAERVGRASVTPVEFPGPARHGHACTKLDDGSVVVSGGLDAAGRPLDDLWRYTPR